MSRTQIEKDFSQLYIGQDQRVLVENYYKKKRRMMVLLVFAGFGLLFLLIFQALQEGQLEEGNRLERNDYGQGAKEVDLEVKLNEEEWQSMTITLEELEYSQEEIEESFERVEEKLPEIILGENETVDEIKSDLMLPSQLEGYPLFLTWKSGSPELLDSTGKLNRENLTKENLTKEGSLVLLTVKMGYGEWEREHSFYVRIAGEDEKVENPVLQKLSESIQKTEEEQRKEKSVELPSKLDNLAVQWRYPLDKSIFILFIIIPVLVFVIWREQDKEIHKKAEIRREFLKSQYPEFVTKLVLLLEAGMSVKGAFFRIAEDYQRKKKGGKKEEYLYEELQYICQRMKNGMGEKEAYELLGRRCGLPLYRKLSTLLIQNLQRGASGMADTLRQESWKANEERKNQVKRKGEEAGTKLLFPMILMLGIVMVLVIVPACFSFQM